VFLKQRAQKRKPMRREVRCAAQSDVSAQQTIARRCTALIPERHVQLFDVRFAFCHQRAARHDHAVSMRINAQPPAEFHGLHELFPRSVQTCAITLPRLFSLIPFANGVKNNIIEVIVEVSTSPW